MSFFREFAETFSPNIKTDVLSGLTVALALVPEAVAFAFVAGVHPLVGLYAAFMVGLITACIGGRPGMISGATGALAVVMVALVADAERMYGDGMGLQYLLAAVVLMGVIQIAAGALRLGKFIRLVPHPVMLGFVNGLAIVIFLAQLPQLQISTPEGKWGWLSGEWFSGMQLYVMLGLIALTMFITINLPKLTKAVPSALAGILVASLLAFGLDLDTRTVGDLASIAGGLPPIGVPDVPFNLETLMFILPYSAIFAAIGLIESLLTVTVIDEMTNTRGRGNKECVAQGTANVVTGFIGGMGGCAMIGQSIINVSSGGRGRLSGIAAALFLLSFILFASPLIEQIPIAALVGVMFMVVIGTFEWASFRMVGKIPKHDLFVLVLVTVVTVLTDLAIAVIIGVVVSALVFAWQGAKRIHVLSQKQEDGSKVYKLYGPLFFGSVASFKDLFDVSNDPTKVIIDFADSRVMDHSALEAIDTLAERYIAEGKEIHLLHLSQECRTLLKQAGSLCEVNVIEDPNYKVAVDELA
ncbi:MULTISPECIES: SulP family inorganic anion transporter [unclassified Oceanobacter]|uniref:SulP family inorganic anion transporter n=1 Tax=unclassified Oceanobacter TaxID=2620260 RepID=UPI0026E1E634|nr:MULTISPECIES: SulP family inorganic anion transporter [unclassified Oceanobacter]MDO6681213.1 SulP family inorganic anion transporter [Oceanobacter sp. 5_MG-2023]MDP2504220.1 SulP family inorganic anion transporter [Oceanobacter sp. 3_MG-2023]MDP2608601.1 SulP family inorganic anion transporter [Oceanobacter sp. 1_MG-2023]MDP2611637.1 SulP family inorganic anion transporter [Oceanobacter sp. 2_MG-2023]